MAGYFDLIGRVDEFILYDDRQYTKKRLAQPEPDQDAAGHAVADDPGRITDLGQRIDEAEVADPRWAERTLADARRRTTVARPASTECESGSRRSTSGTTSGR